MRRTAARALLPALILFAGVSVLSSCKKAADPDELAVDARPIPDNPEVALRVLLKVGAAEDPTGKDGLCCLTWRMLAEGGTRLRSLEDIAKAYDPEAAGFSLRLEKEVAVFSAVVRKDDLAAFYAVFKDMLLDPGFRADDFERLESDQFFFVQTALAGHMDEPFGTEILNMNLYRDHPYGRTDAGTVETVKGLTIEDVKAFYREHFVRGNIVIGLAGGYPADFPARVRADFEKLPAGFTPRLPLPKPQSPRGLEFILVDKAAAIPTIALGFPIPRPKSEKAAWALRIAAAHFNERPAGESGRRDDFAEPNLGRRQRYFSIRAQPGPAADLPFHIRRVLRELKSVAESGLTEERFQSLREAILKSLGPDSPTPERQLFRQMAARDNGFDFGAEAGKILAGLTLRDVNKTVRKYLQAENVLLVVVTPKAAELRDALLANAPSPNPEAGTNTPADRLTENSAILVYPLAVKAENIRIISAGEFFLKPGSPGKETSSIPEK
jgi:zinc protease